MQTRELTLGDGVPSTFIASAPSAPLVLFSNGYAAPRSQAVPPGAPENPISPPLVSGLLAAGYNVLVPENPKHGERLNGDETTTRELTRGFLGQGPDLSQVTVDETARILDDAVGHGLVTSASDVAVLGHSWGGYQSILRLTGDRRIACGVALIPVIDPRCLEPFAALPPGGRLDDRPLALRAVEGLHARPLLIIASSDDEVAPAPYARRFVRTLRANPPAGSGVDYRELDSAGHHYDPRQLATILAWLPRHLPAARSVCA
jgi:pimeloyl-ACP methyl ester carboxylesterase